MKFTVKNTLVLIATSITLIVLLTPFLFLKKSVKEIAKETTVLIVGSPSGSGVIIKRLENKYYILTALHTVFRDEMYRIKTYDGELHEVDNSKIIKDSKLDLAIVEFTANKNKIYSYAKLSEKIRLGMTVYVSGWKQCSIPGYEFNQGKILEIIPLLGQNSNNNTDNISFDEGYLTKYTNSTIDGMSGSPVFDDQGRLIAIHGKSEYYKSNTFDFEKCPPLDQKFGNNLGIAMEKFFTSDLKSKLPFDIKAENSNVIYYITNYIKNIGKSPQPTKPPEETQKGCIFCRPINHQTP